jgi:hypothetical protein
MNHLNVKNDKSFAEQRVRGVDGASVAHMSLCTIFDGERIANSDGEGCWSFRMSD